ncbi:MAG: DUF2231 domain-containing protein [Candidatus Dadabacteria bacterium]|nr:MAG: DUF2231 domain-containing protein [Candidatus Dadabacteria bacterium]
MIQPHPIIVHFPIALLIISTLFALMASFFSLSEERRKSFNEISCWNHLFGLLGAGAAVLTGEWEEESIAHNETIHEIMETHETLGYIILILFAVLFLWRLIKKNNVGKIFAALMLVGSVLIGYTGHLGGTMVYKHGAGVEGAVSKESAEHHHHGNETNEEGEHTH